MEDFIQLLTDKRFSLKFRILNILSGDYLRNYLAGVQGYINKCNEVLNNDCYSDTYKIKIIKRNIDKAKKGISDVGKI